MIFKPLFSQLIVGQLKYGTATIWGAASNQVNRVTVHYMDILLKSSVWCYITVFTLIDARQLNTHHGSVSRLHNKDW